VHEIIPAARLRPHLVTCLEQGIEKERLSRAAVVS
jgi:hypothetical protein